jgi:hypothetical protein
MGQQSTRGALHILRGLFAPAQVTSQEDEAEHGTRHWHVGETHQDFAEKLAQNE